MSLLMQAQLLGITRSKPGEPPGVNYEQYARSPPRTKHKPVVTKSVVDRSPPRKDKDKKAMLDTPAPRRVAPVPASYQAPPPQETKLENTPIKQTKRNPRHRIAVLLINKSC